MDATNSIKQWVLTGSCRFALMIVAGICLFISGQHSFAQTTPFAAKDSDDGSNLTGFRISSAGGGGFLFFSCDDNKETPQLYFAHKKPLGNRADPIRFYYSIDDGPLLENWMLVKTGEHSAYFFVRYPEDYTARFGDQPSAFQAGSNNVNPAYQEWDRNIHMQVIQDFADGAQAIVEIVDQTKTRYRYRYSLKGVTNALSDLSACFSSPRALTGG